MLNIVWSRHVGGSLGSGWSTWRCWSFELREKFICSRNGRPLRWNYSTHCIDHGGKCKSGACPCGRGSMCDINHRDARDKYEMDPSPSALAASQCCWEKKESCLEDPLQVAGAPTGSSSWPWRTEHPKRWKVADFTVHPQGPRPRCHHPQVLHCCQIICKGKADSQEDLEGSSWGRRSLQRNVPGREVPTLLCECSF